MVCTSLKKTPGKLADCNIFLQITTVTIQFYLPTAQHTVDWPIVAPTAIHDFHRTLLTLDLLWPQLLYMIFTGHCWPLTYCGPNCYTWFSQDTADPWPIVAPTAIHDFHRTLLTLDLLWPQLLYMIFTGHCWPLTYCGPNCYTWFSQDTADPWPIVAPTAIHDFHRTLLTLDLLWPQLLYMIFTGHCWPLTYCGPNCYTWFSHYTADPWPIVAPTAIHDFTLHRWPLTYCGPNCYTWFHTTPLTLDLLWPQLLYMISHYTADPWPTVAPTAIHDFTLHCWSLTYCGPNCYTWFSQDTADPWPIVAPTAIHDFTLHRWPLTYCGPNCYTWFHTTLLTLDLLWPQLLYMISHYTADPWPIVAPTAIHDFTLHCWLLTYCGPNCYTWFSQDTADPWPIVAPTAIHDFTLHCWPLTYCGPNCYTWFHTTLLTLDLLWPQLLYMISHYTADPWPIVAPTAIHDFHTTLLILDLLWPQLLYMIFTLHRWPLTYCGPNCYTWFHTTLLTHDLLWPQLLYMIFTGHRWPLTYCVPYCYTWFSHYTADPWPIVAPTAIHDFHTTPLTLDRHVGGILWHNE